MRLDDIASSIANVNHGIVRVSGQELRKNSAAPDFTRLASCSYKVYTGLAKFSGEVDSLGNT